MPTKRPVPADTLSSSGDGSPWPRLHYGGGAWAPFLKGNLPLLPPEHAQGQPHDDRPASADHRGPIRLPARRGCEEHRRQAACSRANARPAPPVRRRCRISTNGQARPPGLLPARPRAPKGVPGLLARSTQQDPLWPKCAESGPFSSSAWCRPPETRPRPSLPTHSAGGPTGDRRRPADRAREHRDALELAAKSRSKGALNSCTGRAAVRDVLRSRASAPIWRADLGPTAIFDPTAMGLPPGVTRRTWPSSGSVTRSVRHRESADASGSTPIFPPGRASRARWY